MNIYTSNPFLKARKQDYLTVIFGLILIIIILIIVATTLNNKQNQEKESLLATPTKAPVIIQTNNGTIKYNADKQDALYQKLQNPSELSQSDNSVKTQLINSLGNETGMLYQSSNVAISYIKSVDLFQAEILTPDIQTAKQEANDWFSNQGLSHQGMCNLPVVFFLNSHVADQLRNNSVIFNPLSNGC